MNPTDGTHAADQSPEDAAVAARRRSVADGGVMSFGEHLEELRACCIRALVGLLVTTIFSLIFAKRILAFILKPALVVLEAHGQRPEMQALAPPDTFIMYLRLALICGVILAMPWILMQIWRFIAVGLYSHEKRFIRTLTPVSIGLFIAGVLFMFFLALPIVLNFFVKFTQQIQVEELRPSFLQAWMIGEDTAANPPALADDDFPKIPVVEGAPPDVSTGGLWFDASLNRLCMQGREPGQMFTIPLQPAHGVQAVRSYFSLSQYVSFVLMLSLGFGIAFELPMIVLFLTAIGIVSVDSLAKYRRHVILAIVFAAAVLTPPDVISQVLLAIPMIILFEGALFAARRFVDKKPQPEVAS